MMMTEEQIRDSISPEPNSGCWLWIRGNNTIGYGKVTIRGRTYMAHRVVYEHYKGPIPEGMEIDHKCHVRCCVNPDHLDAVTGLENVRRAFAKGKGGAALNKAKTHCKRGHAFTSGNTIAESGGRRRCRECTLVRHRSMRARKRAARAQIS